MGIKIASLMEVARLKLDKVCPMRSMAQVIIAVKIDSSILYSL